MISGLVFKLLLQLLFVQNLTRNLVATRFQFGLFIFQLSFNHSTSHSDLFFKNRFLVVPENYRDKCKRIAILKTAFVLSCHYTLRNFWLHINTTISNVRKTKCMALIKTLETWSFHYNWVYFPMIKNASYENLMKDLHSWRPTVNMSKFMLYIYIVNRVINCSMKIF